MLCIKSNPPARWSSDVCLDRDTENAECLLIKRWYRLSVGLTRSLSIYISPSLPLPQLLKLPWQLLLPLFLSSTWCLLLPGRHQFHHCVPLLSIQQRLWCSWLVHPVLHIVTNCLRMWLEIVHTTWFWNWSPSFIQSGNFAWSFPFYPRFFSSSYKPAGLPKSALMTIVFRPPRMRLYLQPIRISLDLCPTSNPRSLLRSPTLSLSLWHWSALYIWCRNLKLNLSIMKARTNMRCRLIQLVRVIGV